MVVRRAFPNILSDRLPETRDFYVGLLGLATAWAILRPVRRQPPAAEPQPLV